jgi:hypothetical protein
MGDGQTMFVIKALCTFSPDKTHEPVARAIAKYAVDHGYTKKVAQSWWNGVLQQPSGAIGVALMRLSEDGSTAVSGFRYHFTIADLQDQKH